MKPTPKFWINSIHQIELTSRCNLRCRYCVHPTMPRAKQDMPMDVYAKALEWAAHFTLVKKTQREVNLCGIGESTLLPDLVERVRMAREACGPDIHIHFATNGLEMTEDLAAGLAPYRPRIAVSLHRPEKTQDAIIALSKYGLLAAAACDAAYAGINWAGQVKWKVTAPAMDCAWVKYGRAFVMSDGRMSACSLDGSGSGSFANIMDFDVAAHRTTPYDLCRTCHQTLNIPGFDQIAGAMKEAA